MFFRRVFGKNSNSSDEIVDSTSNYSPPNNQNSTPSPTSPQKLQRRASSDDRQQRGLSVLQLTPLWEHVIRTNKLPMGLNLAEMFEEFLERLHDPEWQVRQHALRVLVDVILVMCEKSDLYMAPLIGPLVENLGHPAPAVRKGALDVLRVYVSQTAMPETVMLDIMDYGMERPSKDPLANRLAIGVMLSLPSLIHPTLMTVKRVFILRSVIKSLSSKMVQVTYQEIALNILMKIKEMIGSREFYECMAITSRREFEILCNVYKVPKSPNVRDSGIDLHPPSSTESKLSWKSTPNIHEMNGAMTPASPRRKVWNASNDNLAKNKEMPSMNHIHNGDVRVVDKVPGKKCENYKCEIIKVDENNMQQRQSPPDAKVIMETEIKINSDTLMMRIFETPNSNSASDNSDDDEEIVRAQKMDGGSKRVVADIDSEFDETQENEDDLSYGRRTPRRVRFGGEIVKMRTPDSDTIEQSDVDALNISSSSTTTTATTTTTTTVSTASTAPSTPTSGRSTPLNNDYSKELTIKIPDDELQLVIPSRPKTASAVKLSTCPPPTSPKIIKIPPTSSSSSSKNPSPMPTPVINSAPFAYESPEPATPPALPPPPPPPPIITPIERRSRTRTRSHSASPNRPRRRISISSDLSLSPGSRHNGIEMMHNLLRSPSVSPTRIRRSTSSSNVSATGADRGTRLRPLKTAPINGSKQTPTKSATKPASDSSKIETSVQTGNELFSVKLAEISTQTTIVQQSSEEKPVMRQQPPPPPSPVTVAATQTSVVRGKFIDDSFSSSNDSATEKPNKTWEELDIVERHVIMNLRSGDWRLRGHAIGNIEDALKSTDNLAKLQPYLASFLRTLLSSEKHPDVCEDKRRILVNLISRLPLENLEDRTSQIVTGLCRQGGAGSNTVAKALMQRLPTAAIVLRLLSDDFLHARSSKFRENALQMVLFALMTFPSTYFDIGNCVGRATKAALDRKKRVRQAALDVLAVLGQISSPQMVLDVVNTTVKYRQDGDELLKAVKARLARKQLPKVTQDGHVQYAFKIPSPHASLSVMLYGADIDWITSGSGSVSPTSMKNRAWRFQKYQGFQVVDDSGNRFGGNNDSNKKIITTMAAEGLKQRFGQKPPHELLGIGVGVKNSVFEGSGGVGGRNDGGIAGWSKIPVSHNMEDDRNIQLGLNSTIPVYHNNMRQQQQQQQNNFARPLYTKTQSRSFPELSQVAGHKTFSQDRDFADSRMEKQWNGKQKTSKLPVTSRFPAMEEHRNTVNNGHIVNMNPYTMISNGTSRAKNNIYISKMFNQQRYNDGFMSDSIGSPVYQSTHLESRPATDPSFDANSIFTINNGKFNLQQKYPKASSMKKNIIDSNKCQQKSDAPVQLKLDQRPIYENPKGTSTNANESSRYSSANSNKRFNSSYKSIESNLNEIDRDSKNFGSDKIKNSSTSTLSTHPLSGTPTGDNHPADNNHDSQLSRPQTVIGTNKSFLFDSDEDIMGRAKTALSERILSTNSMSNGSSNTNGNKQSKKSSSIGSANDMNNLNSNTNSPFRRIPSATPNDIDGDLSSNSISSESESEDYEDEEFEEPVVTRAQSGATRSAHSNHSNSVPKSPKHIMDNSMGDGDHYIEQQMGNRQDGDHADEMHHEEAADKQVNTVAKKTRPPILLRNRRVTPLKNNSVTPNSKKGGVGDTSGPRKSVEKPKDAVLDCVAQMEDSNWQSNILGIQNFVRLIRNHPDAIESQIHLVCVALSKQIKNLRSQVARAACEAAGEFFVTHRRSVETEAEDIALNLFQITADTNKFLRADAMKALESMCDSLSPHKLIYIITFKGATHQNAVVRTTAAKLLNKIIERIGGEKIFTMSRDCRDRVILTGANLLMEGSLETRNHTKDMFKQLSAYHDFHKVIMEVIPQRIYRNIEKTLKNIK